MSTIELVVASLIRVNPWCGGGFGLSPANSWLEDLLGPSGGSRDNGGAPDDRSTQDRDDEQDRVQTLPDAGLSRSLVLDTHNRSPLAAAATEAARASLDRGPQDPARPCWAGAPSPPAPFERGRSRKACLGREWRTSNWSPRAKQAGKESLAPLKLSTSKVQGLWGKDLQWVLPLCIGASKARSGFERETSGWAAASEGSGPEPPILGRFGPLWR